MDNPYPSIWAEKRLSVQAPPAADRQREKHEIPNLELERRMHAVGRLPEPIVDLRGANHALGEFRAGRR